MEDYNPSIPSKEEYMEPRRRDLRRFLKRVDLIFRESVMRLTEYNVKRWVDYLKQFVMPYSEEVQARKGKLIGNKRVPKLTIQIEG